MPSSELRPARERLLRASPDVWVARALLLLGLLMVFVPGTDHAQSQPVYGPIDEASHLGYIAKVAETGLPPVQGRDLIFFRPFEATRPNDVTIKQPLDPKDGGAPLPIDPNTGAMGQLEAIQPPLYYYVTAPFYRLFQGDRQIFVLRELSVLFMMAGVAALYWGMRRNAPDRPLAAGVAAIALATMSGYVHYVSAIQNDALVMPLTIALLGVVWLQLRERRSTWGLALLAGITGSLKVVAMPYTFLAVLGTVWWATRGTGTFWSVAWRRTLVYALPTIPWVLWNLKQYHWVLPRDLAAAETPNHLHLLGYWFIEMEHAATQLVLGLWTIYYPAMGIDQRAFSLLALTTLVSLTVLLLTGRIEAVRIRLGLWGVFMLTTFLSVYTILLFGAAQGNGIVSFDARYFSGAAASGAAVFALTTDAAFATRPRLARAGAIVLALTLSYWALQNSSLQWLRW